MGKSLDIYLKSPILVVLLKTRSVLADSIEIQVLFKKTVIFEYFSRQIHLQGLFQAPLHFQVLFKLV